MIETYAENFHEAMTKLKPLPDKDEEIFNIDPRPVFNFFEELTEETMPLTLKHKVARYFRFVDDSIIIITEDSLFSVINPDHAKYEGLLAELRAKAILFDIIGE